MAHEEWASGMGPRGQPDYVTGGHWVTDISQGEVNVHQVKGRGFGHLGHEFEITKTPPYQFPFIFDLDLMLRTYT